MSYYRSTDGQTFRILEEYTQDGELWVRYQNTHTLAEYTATWAAFQTRFSPTVPPSRNNQTG